MIKPRKTWKVFRNKSEKNGKQKNKVTFESEWRRMDSVEKRDTYRINMRKIEQNEVGEIINMEEKGDWNTCNWVPERKIWKCIKVYKRKFAP